MDVAIKSNVRLWWHDMINNIRYYLSWRNFEIIGNQKNCMIAIAACNNARILNKETNEEEEEEKEESLRERCK